MDTEKKPGEGLLKKAFARTLPVMAAYVVLGMGFGILMSDKGYGPFWSIPCSLFIFAGSMQYVTVDMLAGAAPLVRAALMTLMVNARHLFYGISMIGKYRDMGRAKPYLIFGLTDETYSLLCGGEDYPPGQEERYCFLVTLIDQAYWVAGTAAGACIGSFFPFSSKGIDFSMTALFVTVFVEQYLKAEDHRPALTGIGASLLCLVLFGSSRFLIPAMLLITAGLSLPYFRKEGRP